jgi:hypothetical protein
MAGLARAMATTGKARLGTGLLQHRFLANPTSVAPSVTAQRDFGKWVETGRRLQACKRP